MSRRRLCCVVVVVVSLCSPPPTPAASLSQINQTITKAKTWLYAQQNTDHTWERDFSGHGDQKTGQTALAVYALLSAGESRQDPRLAAAIDYLKKTDTTGVYALGMRCQVWLMLPATPEIRAAATKDAKVLLQSLKRTGDAKGFYDYNPSGDKTYSHSRAQYAVLGLWAAAQMGVPVPRDYWSLVEKAWTDHQDPSGGWNYIYKRDTYPLTPGMTAVGVATLFITQDFLHAGDAAVGNGNIHNPAIERGMKWLTENFARVATDQKSARSYPFATLYAIERIGVASGTKYFGDVDWYDKGAEFLVDQQRSDGSFAAEYDSKVVSTCFSLLFLSRGAYPVMMNKLDYSAGAAAAGSRDEPHWNQRPRDVANVARWTGRQIERDLNWEIVPLSAPVEDWQDAPILYVSGNQPLELSAEHEAKLKQFVEQGGLVLANADGGSAAFAKSFQALGQKLFPSYKFAPLPENHVIFTGEQFPRATWKRKPTVVSLGNGVRELFVLLPDSDAARAWQTQDVAKREELFQLAANLFLYAVDKKNLRRRGESYLVSPDPKVQATKTVKLARIEYAGNWDPEPGGWRRLAAVMHNERKVDLAAEPVKLGAGKLGEYLIAHLTGTAGFTLNPPEREELKTFLARGGTLVVDAAGGTSSFATAAEAELAAIVPDAAAQLATPLPGDHPIYSAGGTKPPPIEYRPFARAKLGQLKGPRLRGVTVGGRLVVIYSREDLSGGLVGQSVDGIAGYSPECATALMEKLIEYAVATKK